MLWTAATVLVLASGVLVWRHVDAKARREYEAAKAAFAKHGFPTRIEEIMPAPIADEDDADTLLREAWMLMTGSSDWEASSRLPVFEAIELLDYATPSTPTEPSHLIPEKLHELHQLSIMPEVAAFAAAMRRAAEKPAWRWDIDVEAGPQMLLPHLGPARYLVRMLSRQAVGVARDPALVQQAWNDLVVAQKIGSWPDEYPFLISHLTAIACHSIIRDAAMTVLQSADSDVDVAEFLARELEYLPQFTRQLEVTAHGERLGMLGWYEDFLGRNGNWLASAAHLEGGPTWLKWGDPWLPTILAPVARPRFWKDMREWQQLHLDVSLALRTAESTMLEALENVAQRVKSPDHLWSGWMFPSYPKLAATHLRAQSERCTFVLVLAALQHRQRTGAWPTTIAELQLPHTVTIDPCSQQPFILLSADERGFTVYGYGLDRDDDAGRPLNPNDRRDDDGDIVIRLRLPKQADN